MKFIILIFVLFSTVLFGQNILPNLELKNNIDPKNDVQKILKLKKNDIAISFYKNGGMMYQFDIDNFIFRESGKIKYYKEKIFFKRGKKYRKDEISLTTAEQTNLREIVESDFFKDFSKYTQKEFEFSENNHQICAGGYIDDAPENFIMITQNGKANKIMVYLPKNNMKCSDENSPLMKFIELHQLFNIELDR